MPFALVYAQLAAGNTFSHSQLRVWDVPSGTLVDRFSLPAACRGVRCVQLVQSSHVLIVGCANGWIFWCDLRTGRYERRLAHSECVNTLHVRGNLLVSAGDEGVVRLTDMRTLAPVGAHKLTRIVNAACCDEERLYVACDDGLLRMYDYSDSAARLLKGRNDGGGFTQQQREAFARAIEAARRRESVVV